MLDAPMTQALSRYLDMQTARMKLTATNMANQNTAGYARRIVTWSSGDTIRLSGAVPLEHPVATVTAQRSLVLDAAVADTNADAAAASTTKAALNSLQSVFAIGSSGDESSGINAALSGFFSAMQSIAADPGSSTARQTALAAAKAVSASFQATSATIMQQSADLDSTIQNAVGSVNEISASIASLNGSIANAANATDRDAFIDQRSAQIDNLSQLIGVQQTTSSDGSVSLYTTSGGALVTGSMGNPVTASVFNGKLQLYVQGTNINAGLQGGSIGGALSVRDGAVANTQTRLDVLASSVATAVNAANMTGTTPAGSLGQAVFSIDASSTHPAATLAVIAADGSAFAAAGSGEGQDGATNANAMALLANQKDASGDTFADALSAMISSIGTAAANANTSSAAATSAQSQAAAAQEAVSGVSLDTEAANLTQYQRSYEAEAKLLSILTQIMTDSINLGTNTAVS